MATEVRRRDEDQPIDDLLARFKKIVQAHKIRKIRRAQEVFLTKGQKKRESIIARNRKRKSYASS